MTAPDTPPPPPDDETLAFEVAAVAAVTGALAAMLADFAAHVLATYAVLAASGPLAPDVARALGTSIARTLRQTRPASVDATLRQYAETARVLGVRQELDRTGHSGASVPLPDVPSVSVDAMVRTGLDEAARIASTGIRTKADAASVAGRLRRTRADVQGAVRWTVHDGVNAGTDAVARHLGRNLIWVAERNACLHCLAHAGWVVEPGGLFPPVTFDPRGTSLRPVAYPPLHPGCRCRARTTTLPAGRPPTDRSRTDAASRLAGEARRSVVLQWTDYASAPAAERAAERLLHVGAHLPTTVEQRARNKLRGGRR